MINVRVSVRDAGALLKMFYITASLLKPFAAYVDSLTAVV